MRTLPAIALVVLVAGCSTSNSRRDLDVTGSLPQAIGLGAFAPTCFAFCFVSADFTQGDIIRERITDEFSVHSTTEQQRKAAPR